MLDRSDRGTIPPRVLLLGSFPPQAQGISGYCGALATALAAELSVEAIGFKAMYPRCFFPGATRSMDGTAKAPVASTLSLRHVLTWYNPLGWCWYAWKSPAEVFHLQWWSLPLFPVLLVFALVARLRQIPLVLTVHNVLPHERSAGYLRAGRLLYRLAHRLVVHSESNRKQLCSRFGVSPDDVSCIPMGIPAAASGLPPRDVACAALHLPNDRPILLFFGVIRPYKGLDILLEAFAQLLRRHPDVILLVAGELWGSWEGYQQQIDDFGLEEHLVIHRSYVPENQVAHYYGACDLVVLPYRHFEAQSAVGVQAMGYGKPVLVTDTGGLPELVGGAGSFCVAPQDGEALAAALGHFFDDPVRGAAAFWEGRALAHEDRSWSACAAAHLSVYRGVLG